MRAFTHNNKTRRAPIAAWLILIAALSALLLIAILADPHNIEADMAEGTLAQLETKPLFWAFLALAASLLMATLLKKLLLPLILIKIKESPNKDEEELP